MAIVTHKRIIREAARHKKPGRIVVTRLDSGHDLIVSIHPEMRGEVNGDYRIAMDRALVEYRRQGYYYKEANIIDVPDLSELASRVFNTNNREMKSIDSEGLKLGPNVKNMFQGACRSWNSRLKDELYPRKKPGSSDDYHIRPRRPALRLTPDEHTEELMRGLFLEGRQYEVLNHDRSSGNRYGTLADARDAGVNEDELFLHAFLRHFSNVESPLITLAVTAKSNLEGTLSRFLRHPDPMLRGKAAKLAGMALESGFELSPTTQNLLKKARE